MDGIDIYYPLPKHSCNLPPLIDEGESRNFPGYPVGVVAVCRDCGGIWIVEWGMHPSTLKNVRRWRQLDMMPRDYGYIRTEER